MVPNNILLFIDYTLAQSLSERSYPITDESRCRDPLANISSGNLLEVGEEGLYEPEGRRAPKEHGLQYQVTSAHRFSATEVTIMEPA